MNKGFMGGLYFALPQAKRVGRVGRGDNFSTPPLNPLPQGEGKPSSFFQQLKHAIILVFFFTSTFAAAEVNNFPFKQGETIHYDIKKMGMRAGQATLVFNGLEEKDGQKILLITFTAKGFQFFDQEKIYLDPKTFYPVLVERDLDIFGKKEKITESYLKDSIKIVKDLKDNHIEEVLKNDGRVDNIYGFIYRYRAQGTFRVGEEHKINLPTQKVTVKLAAQKELEIAGEKYDSFYVEGQPKRIKMWFANTPEKLPLRIDGALMGKTTMVLRKQK